MRANNVVQSYHLTPVLICLDFFVLAVVSGLVLLLFQNTATPQDDMLLLFSVASTALVMAYIIGGVYQAWRHKKATYFLGRVGVAWLCVCMVVLAANTLQKGELMPPNWLVLWLFLAWLSTYGYRLAIGLLLIWYRAKGFNNKTILFLGRQQSVDEMVEYFDGNRQFGFDVYDKLYVEENQDFEPSAELLATLQDEQNAPTEVWLCLPLARSELIKKLIFDLKNSASDIRLVPDEEDQILLSHPYQAIMGLNVVDLNYSPLHGVNHALKAITDFVVALLILLMISPIMIGLALAVKITSKGPVFFVQQRNGAGGKIVNVYKFRSMKVHDEQTGTVTQATKGDSRLTSIGAFIRRTSLDELPQFLNVLQGRMSVVGPRPHARAHNSEYSHLVDSYMSRHRVKPGITGWAQINGFRGETDTLDKMENRIKHDLWYIENWSWWLDIKIIFLTIFKGFINKNAY